MKVKNVLLQISLFASIGLTLAIAPVAKAGEAGLVCSEAIRVGVVIQWKCIQIIEDFSRTDKLYIKSIPRRNKPTSYEQWMETRFVTQFKYGGSFIRNQDYTYNAHFLNQRKEKTQHYKIKDL